MKTNQLKNICLALFIGISLTGAAQSGKLKKANQNYALNAYAAAAENYEKVIGSDLETPQIKAKLATCYLKMGEYSKSVDMFNQITTSLDFTPEDTYNYAQALKMAGNYQMSDVWMKKFAQRKPQDSRSVAFLKNPDYLKKIQESEPHFSLKRENFNTPYTDFGGYVKDASTIYIASSRPTGGLVKRYYDANNEFFLDLFEVSKDGHDDFNKVKRLRKKVNSKYHEGPLCFTQDLKRVYFTRNNGDKGSAKKDSRGFVNLKIYYADINEKGRWENIKEVSLNNKDFSVGHPSISMDGRYMYFVSDMPGGYGGADIYIADIQENGDLKNPKNLGDKINTEGDEMFPWINGDGNLYFSSNGQLGLGGLDVFVALMDKSSHTIQKILNCGKEINSPQDDFALSFGPDYKTGFVSSNRKGGLGKDDIYGAKLIRPFEMILRTKGVVTDKETDQPVADAMIHYIDPLTNDTLTVASNDNGEYELVVEPEKEYKIYVDKKDYVTFSDGLSTKGLDPSTNELEKNFSIEKDPLLSLFVLVTDKGERKPLQGVKVKVLDNFTNTNFIRETTGEDGTVKKAIKDKKVGDRVSYNIHLEKEGYLTKTVTFNYQIPKAGPVKVHESIDLSMDKLEVGKDLAKMIDLKPIYFDLGKATIRKDAAIELDKIVEVMNNHPDMIVELGSHTDCRSSYAFNMNLSQKRAAASADYIKKRITNPERIYGKGYGESRLVNGCACEGNVKSDCTEEEHQANRRTEFIVVKM